MESYQGYRDSYTVLCGLTPNTHRFFDANGLFNDNYLAYLNRPEMIGTVNFIAGFHAQDTRKTTGDPCLKHLIYTGFILFKAPFFQSLPEEDKQIAMKAALLHDAIELKRKKDPNFNTACFQQLINNEESNIANSQYEAEAITLIVDRLTPMSLIKGQMGQDEWIREKQREYERSMGVTLYDLMMRSDELLYLDINIGDIIFIQSLIQQIQIADELAILDETVDDVQQKHDGASAKSNGIKPLEWRIRVFEDIFSYVSSDFVSTADRQSIKDKMRYLRLCSF